MIALVSDIHANKAALFSVFDDIEQRSPDRILCLGDIVGYGPDPEVSVDMIMDHADVTLKGNHDWALIHGPIGFNKLAADIIHITKDMLKPQESPGLSGIRKISEICRQFLDGLKSEPKCLSSQKTNKTRWHFIENLKESYEENDVLFVHGSPVDPIFDYVFPDKVQYLWQPGNVEEIFKKTKRLLFVGHTHIPCVIDDRLHCWYPSDDEPVFTIDPDKKYLINTGSVGQPRDGDSRASYALFDEQKNTVTWRRVPYNIDETAAGIEKLCGKDNWCARRLFKGR